LHTVLNVIGPVFGIVLLGFGLTRTGVLSAATSEGLTRFMFYVAVPAMLFRTFAATALPDSVPWAYIAAFYGASFVAFGLGMTLARWRWRWSRRDQGIGGLAAGYSNMVMLGFPLVITAFGESAALPLFILLALQSLLMFPLTTWVIEIYGNTGNTPRTGILATFGKLALNPVIASLLLGIGANLSGLEITGPLSSMLELIGAAAPACALVALGAGLAQYEIRGAIRESLGFVVLKSIIHPILVWAACLALDVAALWTQVAVVLAAMPTGINAFIFARNYDARIEVVSKTIVFSTLVSIVTVAALLHRFLNQGV